MVHGFRARSGRTASWAVVAAWLLSAHAGSVRAADSGAILDGWLARQAGIESWVADVIEIRKAAFLSRPLVAEGKVWFQQPHRFRSQIGDPPRRIAVRSEGELIVAYPQLKQAERYAVEGPWRHALALVDVGFSVSREEFDARYEMLRVEAVGTEAWRIVLRPAEDETRRLIDQLCFEVASSDFTLLATELSFPDGSTLRNEFRAVRIDVPIDPSLFASPIEPDYQVARPLDASP